METTAIICSVFLLCGILMRVFGGTKNILFGYSFGKIKTVEHLKAVNKSAGNITIGFAILYFTTEWSLRSYTNLSLVGLQSFVILGVYFLMLLIVSHYQIKKVDKIIG